MNEQPGHVCNLDATLTAPAWPHPPSPAICRARGAPGLPPMRFDGYRLVDFLGAGAAGEVFLYHDTVLDVPVAVKLAYESDMAACRRFLREARALAAIEHPNVVAVHRVGRLAGRPYILCEHVGGMSLDRLAPVPWKRALALGMDLARALAAVHARGILHRDIKPANAILAHTGAAKLIDFGLAAWLHEPLPRSGAGAGYEVRCKRPPGTPSYMAPELWQGAAHSPRSDVYALGGLLHALCTGARPPGAGSHVPRLDQVLPGVDARFAAIVHRCLAPAPADRPASGAALCHALEALACRAAPRAAIRTDARAQRAGRASRKMRPRASAMSRCLPSAVPQNDEIR